jgi:hypothetical protein
MAKEKSLVEDAIIQMRNLEEAVAENAKGILASTMKEEIKELVKESLTEQEEEEIDTDVEMDLPMGDEMDTDNIDDLEDDEEESDEFGDNEFNYEDEDEDEDVIDLTREKDDLEILRVFSLLGPNDNVIVKKDEVGNINLKDGDKEYMIVGENEEEDMEMFEGFGELDIEALEEDDDMEMSDEFGDDEEEDEDDMLNSDDVEIKSDEDDLEKIIDKVFGQSYGLEENDEEVVYEIEMDEEEDEEMEEDEEYLEESSLSIKPKGVGMGNPSKFKYSSKPNQGKGFNTKMKEAPKSVGTGKAKFEFKEGENLEGEVKQVRGAKKAEATEAARTYGNGSKSGRGLRKGITPNRNLEFPIKENADAKELQMLREKNEEYRKALNIFRNKLNEVAIFNSNLAYATRLFTECTTSKQEKVNILKRFDSVETIKESKNLYQTLKNELSVKTSTPMNESLESKLDKNHSTGSAVNLIESKTYENPQFLRMKDLMGKLK